MEERDLYTEFYEFKGPFGKKNDQSGKPVGKPFHVEVTRPPRIQESAKHHVTKSGKK